MLVKRNDAKWITEPDKRRSIHAPPTVASAFFPYLAIGFSYGARAIETGGE
jgi:hypothetical protein